MRFIPKRTRRDAGKEIPRETRAMAYSSPLGKGKRKNGTFARLAAHADRLLVRLDARRAGSKTQTCAALMACPRQATITKKCSKPAWDKNILNAIYPQTNPAGRRKRNPSRDASDGVLITPWQG